VRLTIDRLGHLGDGIAPGPVYVPLTLPGEVVDGDVSGDRVPAPRIVTPSADRVRAPCPHYRMCGGCSLMHASDMFAADWKSGVVRNALLAQGLGSPLRHVVTSPARSRRRATFAGRRTKVGALVGFHARGSDQVIAIPDCRLLHPALVATLPALEDLTKVGASRSAPLALAATVTDDGIDLVVSGGKPMTSDLFENLAQLADKADLARLTWGDDVIAARRIPGQTIAGYRVVPPPGAFLQATREGEAALQGAVREALAGAGMVADLFAGCGTFALDLARTMPVHAVEGQAAMLAALDQAWRGATGLKPITTETRDLFRRPLLRSELNRFEAVVIDPPRAGAEEQALAIKESSISHVAMVSCNPVTFARDARILAGAGFRIDWIDVIDQFRWSPHVEVVARMVR
jgi:23S rRNA (uracil1939-C5)-methyltransferase